MRLSWLRLREASRSIGHPCPGFSLQALSLLVHRVSQRCKTPNQTSNHKLTRFTALPSIRSIVACLHFSSKPFDTQLAGPLCKLIIYPPHPCDGLIRVLFLVAVEGSSAQCALLLFQCRGSKFWSCKTRGCVELANPVWLSPANCASLCTSISVCGLAQAPHPL